MDQINRFNYIDTIDVSNIKDVLLKLTKEDWNEFTFRQEQVGPHKYTKSIPLIFDTGSNTIKPVYHKQYNNFEDEINIINDICRKTYSDGYMIKALFVNLPAGKSIFSHKDYGLSLTISNRIHIPIITNDDVIFTVDDESINMKEGEMWEINNSLTHSVDNNGDQDRIHLIVDWLQIKNIIKAM